jgi:DNA-binding transcriptional ArsR family regulator
MDTVVALPHIRGSINTRHIILRVNEPPSDDTLGVVSIDAVTLGSDTSAPITLRSSDTPAAPAPIPHDDPVPADVRASPANSPDNPLPPPLRTAALTAGESGHGGVLAITAGALLALLLAGLYSRFVHRKDVLKNATRAAILAEVRATPGIPVRDLAAKLGLTRSNALHHLRILQRAGFVQAATVGGKSRIYPPGHAPRAVDGAEQHHPLRAAILRALAERPDGMTRGELKLLMPGVPARTQNHNIQRLIATGRVQERAPGSEGVRLQLAPASGSPAVS